MILTLRAFLRIPLLEMNEGVIDVLPIAADGLELDLTFSHFSPTA